MPTSDEPPDGNTQSLKGKTLLLINSGYIGKRFIFEKIKQLGITIVLINKEKNWAAPFVDYWILADTYNHKACIKSFREFLSKNPHVKIDGATTFWEDEIPLLAKFCKEFQFTGNNSEAAANTRSKYYMHETLRQKGRPFIPQYLLTNEDDLEKAINTIGFPAVIKPKYGSDSEYVIYVTNSFEARNAYQYVKENCTPEFNAIYNYNEGKFVYQRYIQGKEFSIECYVQNGIPRVAGINEKTCMDLPFFIETGDYCPARINIAKESALKEEACAAVKALGVENSIAHIEIKWTNKGPKIIEVASRMGGVYIYQNIKEVYDFDLIQTACEIALGIPVTNIPVSPRKCLFAQFFIPYVSGIINNFEGFNTLQDQKNVVGCCIWKQKGDTISVPPEGYETIGWVLTEGRNHAEAEQHMKKIKENVHLSITVPEKPYIVEKNRIQKRIPIPALF